MPAWTAHDFLHLNHRQLMGFMRDGHPIDPAALDDTEYRGVSLGMPELFEKLTWKKFKKVFHRDRSTGRLRGWNVKLDQNELDGPWVPRTKNGVPVTFGHFSVEPGIRYRLPDAVGQGLVLDYGLGGNRRRDGMTLVRDPIVAIAKGSVELFLGRTYVETPLKTVGTPLYFTLERDCPLTHVHYPPKAVAAR